MIKKGSYITIIQKLSTKKIMRLLRRKKIKKDVHKDSINEIPQHFQLPLTQTAATLKTKANPSNCQQIC